jgi:TonB family protein
MGIFMGIFGIAPAFITQATAQTRAIPVIRKPAEAFMATATRQVEPVYPPLAKAAHISGTVIVEVTVETDGRVIAAQGVSGTYILQEAAVAAARGWLFIPTVVRGQMVRVVSTLVFPFTLPDGDDLTQAMQDVASNPSSAEAHFSLSEAYRDAEQCDKAVAELETAIELRPDFEEAYESLAEIYHEQKFYDLEITSYQRGVAAMPQSVELLKLLGDILNDRKRYADSLDVFQKVLDIDAEDVTALGGTGWAYFNLKRYYDAKEVLLRLLQINPDDNQANYTLGASYLAEQNYEQALAMYAKVLDSKSSFHDLNKVYEEAGRCYAHTQRFAEAIDSFTKALEINPATFQDYCLLGTAYMEAQRLDDAIATFKKGIAGTTEKACATNGLAQAYLKSGRDDKAESVLREALQNQPQPELYLRFAALVASKNKPQEAINAYKRAAFLAPKNTAILKSVSEGLAALGKTDDAETYARKILEVEPANLWALNQTGACLLQQNRNLPEALQMLEQAVRGDQSNATYLDNLGWAYCKLDKLTEAEKVLQQAETLNPDSAAIQEHLGELYAKQGRMEIAIKAWQKADNLTTLPEVKARLKARLDNQVERNP